MFNYTLHFILYVRLYSSFHCKDIRERAVCDEVRVRVSGLAPIHVQRVAPSCIVVLLPSGRVLRSSREFVCPSPGFSGSCLDEKHLPPTREHHSARTTQLVSLLQYINKPASPYIRSLYPVCPWPDSYNGQRGTCFRRERLAGVQSVTDSSRCF